MNKRTVCGIMLTLLIVSTLALAFEVQPIRADPATIIVPDDHPTIQDAIDSANEGDTIFVRAGIYHENLYIGTNSLTLLGEDRGTTVIDGGETLDDVVLLGANHVTISGFTLLNSRMHGIVIGHGSFNTICDNIITNMETGIGLHESHHNTITGNAIANCEYHGLGMHDSDENTVFRNAISGNWEAGIALHGSDLNVVRENSVTDNGEEIPHGCNMFLYGWSANNLIFHNDFISHAPLDQVFIIDSTENSWDDGYPSGGNSWEGWDIPPWEFDRYRGINQDEPGSDGIVDEPYVIDDLNRDNYPLVWPRGPEPQLRMEPWSWTHPVGRPITFDASRSYGEIIEYFFDYGDGSVSGWTTDPVQTHSYEQVGEYCAKVLVLDTWGRKAWSYMLRLTIIPAAEPDFEIQVSPDKQSVGREDSAEYTIAVTSINDFQSEVSLYVLASYADLRIEFYPFELTPPPSGTIEATLTITTTSSTPCETFEIEIFATGGGITKNDHIKLSVEISLEVPYQSQGYTMWCGPTSLAMMLRYYGEEFHSWDYALDKNLPTSWQTAIEPPIGEGLEDYIEQNYPDLAVDIRYYWPWTKEEIFTHLKSDISNGFPLILNVGSPPIHQIGHFVVVVGFNDTGIFLNDPSGALFTVIMQPPTSCASYCHAYVDWSKVEAYIATRPLASTMTLKGIPDPNSRFGTMYITSRHDIRFYQPEDHQLNDDHYELTLNQGLNWMLAGAMDPVVDKKCDSLYAHISVSNCRHISQPFTAFCRILGPNDIVHPLGAKEMGAVRAFGEGGTLWQVEDLENLLLKGGPYYLEFDLVNSNGLTVDHFVTQPFYWEKAQSIKLKEKQQHLYLHVYDEEGNHVGLNYATNETELGIQGSYYHDNGNGTTIIVLPQIINLTIVVDAKHAEDPVESYNLTVTLTTDFGVFSETCLGNITAGESQTFSAQVSEVGLELYMHTDVDIDPDTLNLRSNGEWITAYIELPAGYNLSNVDISTVQMNNTISVDSSAPTQIGDYDLDGVPDLMVKFDRASIIEWLGAIDYSEETGKSCLTTITIKGKVSGTAFEGSDTIKTLRK